MLPGASSLARSRASRIRSGRNVGGGAKAGSVMTLATSIAFLLPPPVMNF